MGEVLLWWIGEAPADAALLDRVRRRLAEVYGRAVTPFASGERPADAWDARRRQQASSRVLAFLSRHRPGNASRLLAVTDHDLFIPVLTFVFGEAQLGGRVAVVSTARLGHGPRLPERLATECIHELGHTFGLLHCATPRCAMARSVSLLDVDAKEPHLCPECRARTADMGEPDEQAFDANPDRG